jgi:hypothetical protein
VVADDRECGWQDSEDPRNAPMLIMTMAGQGLVY